MKNKQVYLFRIIWAFIFFVLIIPDRSISYSQALKVAILLPGPVDDEGWSQAGYEGLLLIQKELGAEIAYVESVKESEIEKHFRNFAKAGFDFIIGHGGEYIPGAEVVAKDFPRIKFAVIGGYAGNNSNLGALSFRDGELGYLTGAIAGIKTKTNKVAFIGGVDYVHMKEVAALFIRGAKAVNPSVKVSIEWVNSWIDVEKAKSIARRLIQAKFDVLLAYADVPGSEVLKVAERAGIYSIGWALDQHHMAPKSVLSSGVQHIPLLLLEGAILVQKGRWEGMQYKFGLQEKAQKLAPFYGLLNSKEQKMIEDIQKDIVSGNIDVTF